MTGARFVHEAFMYSGGAEFVSTTVPFIRAGLRAGEPVLVLEPRAKIDMLREALGEDDARLVVFADMAEVGANPARIIPLWRDFLCTHCSPGASMRGIGEPICRGRSADELVECQRHESLVNVAFAGGRPWHLMCPYDTSTLKPAVIAEARRSHEFVRERGSSAPSPEYRGVELSGAPFDQPLGEPAATVRNMSFDLDRLLQLRGEVTQFATGAGLGTAYATRLATAVNEVATNSVVHGGGNGRLRLWRDADVLISEVRDTGSYTLALGDRVKPGQAPDAGRGLWLANQICDLVQIRTLPDATVVRLHMRLHESRAGSAAGAQASWS